MARKKGGSRPRAQALAAGETQRVDQIKQLEIILIGQISKLQYQITESREAEISDLKSEIFARVDETSDQPKLSSPELIVAALEEKLDSRLSELEERFTSEVTQYRRG
jgi:hypothetical protein